MSLKSVLATSATLTAKSTNHSLKTRVVNIFVLCLLGSKVFGSYAFSKHGRSVRQINAEKLINYEPNSVTNWHHQPHFTGNRSVIVQLFEWRFLDVAAECRNFLGPQGYAGVQISPVLEHTVVKTNSLNHPWWERYETISYRLASRSGDESEFWSMTRICNDHGVRIYVDVVFNHMAAPLHFIVDNKVKDKDFLVNTTLETNVNISQLIYSNVSYTQKDFHRPLCMVSDNTQDAHEIRNCQLNGHPDLDHSRASVQQHIVQMLNKFIDMGVAGFRIDAAKYMWPIDLKIIFQQVKNLNAEFGFQKDSRPFFYLDVIDLGLDTVSKTEYSTYGMVSEYLYPAELATIINGRVPLSSLINWGPALGFLAHQDALVFVDSHDTQRGLPLQLGSNKFLTHKQRIKYIMANVFMLVHPYGAVKRIMSSYYFSDEDINQGPPVTEADEEEIRSPQFNEEQQCTKESGWVCEHRWPELVSVLKVANYFKVPGQEESRVIYFQTNGPNQVAFCRGQTAFVAINNDNEMDFEKEVHACLESGTYCDVVTGGKKEGEEECHGKTVIINEQGYTKLQLPVSDGNSALYEEENQGEEVNEETLGRIENYGILVIYVESKIQDKKVNKGGGEAQETATKVDKNEVLEADVRDEQIDDKKEEETKGSGEVREDIAKEDETTANNGIAEVNNEEGEADEASAEIEPGISNADEEDRNEGDNQPKSGENDAEENKKSEDEVEDQEKEAEEYPTTENNANENEFVADEVEESENPNDIASDKTDDTENEEDVGGDVKAVAETEQKESTEKDDEDQAPGEDAEEQEPGENNEETDNEEEINGDKEQKINEDEGEENKARTEENVQEEGVEISNEEKSVPETPVDSKEGEEIDLLEESSPEILTEKESNENQSEKLEEVPANNPETEETPENNQSQNIESAEQIEIEEQLEKPSAEIIVDMGDAADTVTAKVKDIQTAGILTRIKGNDGSG